MERLSGSILTQQITERMKNRNIYERIKIDDYYDHDDKVTCCHVHCIDLGYICVPGTGLLPGPVSELHATTVTNTSVTLQWEAPTDGSNITDYVVHYQQLDNTSMHETVQKLKDVSTDII
jgi:Fibronectin type III domain.